MTRDEIEEALARVDRLAEACAPSGWGFIGGAELRCAIQRHNQCAESWTCEVTFVSDGHTSRRGGSLRRSVWAHGATARAALERAIAFFEHDERAGIVSSVPGLPGET